MLKVSRLSIKMSNFAYHNIIYARTHMHRAHIINKFRE